MDSEQIDNRWFLLALGIVLLPIFFLPLDIPKLDPMRGTRTLLFMGLAWIMALIGGKRSLWALNKPLCLFGIYLIIWQVWLRLSSMYFYGYFLPLLAGILAYPYLASIEEAGQRKVAKWAVILGLAESFMIFGQRLSVHLPPWRIGDLVWPAFHLPPITIFGKSWLIFYPLDSRLIGTGMGTFPGTNPAGAFLAIAGLLALAVGMGWACLLILPALFLTNCLGAILAFLVGILYFVWRAKGGMRFPGWKILALIFAPIAIILAVDLHGWNDSGRLSAWSVAMQAWWGGIGLPEAVRLKWTWTHNPIIGFGPGTFGVIFPAIYQPLTTAASDTAGWNKMHNEFLQILWEYGLIGAGLLAFFLRKLWNMMKGEGNLFAIGVKAAVVAIAVDCLFFFPFQLTETSLLSLGLISFINGDWMRAECA